MKKLLIVIIILLAAGFGAYYYFQSHLDYKPEWYESTDIQALGSDAGQALTNAPSRLQDMFVELKRGVEVNVGEQVLNSVVMGAIDDNIGNADAIVKGIQSSISTDAVDVEMIVDVNEIPWDELPQTYQALRRMSSLMGGNSDSEMYVRLSGMPSVEDGVLQLGEDATIQIGKMSYSVQTLINQLGLSDKLAETLSVENLRFSNISVENGRLQVSR